MAQIDQHKSPERKVTTSRTSKVRKLFRYFLKDIDAITFWTMILATSTFILTVSTIFIFWEGYKQLLEIKESGNVEMIGKLSNEFYENYQTTEVIMLAEKNLLTFVKDDTVLSHLPKHFPIFRINLDSFPDIKYFLSESTIRKPYYSTYEMDKILAVLDRAGGAYRNNRIAKKDLYEFFGWPCIMFAKNKAINDYFNWLQIEYPPINNQNQFGLHYYDLRIMMDVIYNYKPNEHMKVSYDTTKMLDLKKIK
jgi:hypothetical protein